MMPETGGRQAEKSAALCRDAATGQGNIRPHPGPLPQERGNDPQSHRKTTVPVAGRQPAANLVAPGDGRGPGGLRVKVTRETVSPAVYGLFRPVILLPQALTETLAPEQLRAVLLHELMHVRRGDVWVNCAQALLQIVYWWHPLVWVANARLRRLREEAVDDAVVAALREDADVYAPTLLAVAKFAFHRPLASLGLVGILESRSALRQRIERLVNFPPPRKAGLGLVSALGLLVFSAVAVPMGDAPPLPPVPDSPVAVTNNAAGSVAGATPQESKPDEPNGLTNGQAGSLSHLAADAAGTSGYVPPGHNPYDQPGLVNTGPGRHEIVNKLFHIHLGRVDFDRLPLTEVLKNLSAQVKALDPKQTGINFVINPNPNLSEGLAAAAQLDADSVLVSLHLSEVDLVDVMDALVLLADHPIQYSVVDYGIVFSARPAGVEALTMRNFKVNGDVFMQGLEGVGSAGFGVGGNGNGSGLGGGGNSGGGGGGAVVPVVHMTPGAGGNLGGPADYLNQPAPPPTAPAATTGVPAGSLSHASDTEVGQASLPDGRAPGAGSPAQMGMTGGKPPVLAEKKLSAVEVANNQALLRQAETVTLRQKLVAAANAEQAGQTVGAAKLYQEAADLTEQIGAGIDAETALTVAGLARTRLALAREAQTHRDFDEAARQIGLVLKYDPKNPGALVLKQENNTLIKLYDDKKPGAAPQPDPPAMTTTNGQAGSLSHPAAANGAGEPPLDAPGQRPAQLHLKARFIEISGEPGELPTLTNHWDGQNFSGIMAAEPTQKFLRELEAKPGTKIIGAPEVTMLSGRQAQIRATEIVPLLKGINPKALTPPGMSRDEMGADGKALEVSDTNSFMIWTNREFGPVFDVAPQVLADGDTIKLDLSARLDEFAGYEPATNSTRYYEEGHPLTMVEMHPQIIEHQFKAQLNLYDGQTLIWLDDQPLAHSLDGQKVKWDSRTSQPVEKPGEPKRHLLMLVTAILVDPAGNRVHTDDELPFARDRVPAQPEMTATNGQAGSLSHPAADTLVQNGKLLYEMGRLDEAEDKLRQAVQLDTSNKAAIYYLDLIAQARIQRAAPNHVSATQTNLNFTGSGRQRIVNQLNLIRLDSVAFDNVSLDNALITLANKAKVLDPEKNGITFLNSVPVGDTKIKLGPITASLGEVLDAMVMTADHPIKYVIADYGIIFSASATNAEPLIEGVFPVDTSTFIRNLESVPGSGGTNIPTVDFTPGTGQIRTALNQDGGEGVQSIVPKRRLRSLSQLVVDYFADLGIRLNMAGKTVFFNDRLGLLTVRATRADLDAIERAIDVLNQLPPMVHIKARFFAITGALGDMPTLTNHWEGQTLTGIMAAEPAGTFLHELEARPGTESLGEPEATTVSGRRMEMRATTLRSLATIDRKDVPPTGLVTDSSKFGSIPLETGPIFEVLPWVLSDGHTVNLSTLVKVEEFPGYTPPSASDPDTLVYINLKSGKPVGKPRLIEQQIKAGLNKIYDGQTLILFEGEPLAGSLGVDPAMGDGAKSGQADKHLLMLVTAIIVDPAGNRVHQDGELPSARDRVPVQPEMTGTNGQAGSLSHPAADTLVQNGRLFYEMGRLDEAETNLRQAAKLNPDNTATFYYLQLVQQERIHRSATNHVSATQTNLFYTGTGRSKIENKLNRIRLDSVAFTNEPLSNVLLTLAKQSKKLDPEDKGINFLMPGTKPGDPLPTNSALVANTKITLNLTNASLAEVLEAVVKGADHPIKYSIADYAVIFSPKSAVVDLYDRTFRLGEMIVQNLSSPENASLLPNLKNYCHNLGINLDGPGRTVFYNDRLRVLSVRATQDELDKVEQALDALSNPAATNGGNLPSVTRTNNDGDYSRSFRETLKSITPIDLPGDAGTNLRQPTSGLATSTNGQAGSLSHPAGEKEGSAAGAGCPAQCLRAHQFD